VATGSLVGRQRQIEAILNNFDFERVQQVMGLYPREWWNGASGDIPTVDELRGLARELLEQAAEPNQYNCSSVSSGGFHALRFPWQGSGESDCTMELIFSAEDFEA